MTLRLRAARAASPIPLSVLLTLLWSGLVHLLLWLASAQSAFGGDPVSAAAFWGRRVLGSARLPTLLMAVNLLLLLYLWLDYRSSERRGGMRALVFLGAAALVVYLGWALWRTWWGQIGVAPAGDMLLTLAAAGG